MGRDGITEEEEAFRERIFARFGTPKMLVTDNGVQVSSRAFTRFLAELHHQLTALYKFQKNPIERANRTIKTFTGVDQR